MKTLAMTTATGVALLLVGCMHPDGTAPWSTGGAVAPAAAGTSTAATGSAPAAAGMGSGMMHSGPGGGAGGGPGGAGGPGGMGPGMAGGYGAGMGPGMMGGYGGGMGPGMMGGYGGGMGPGMMGGYGAATMGPPGAVWGLERLDLDADQRARIARIQDETRARHLQLMQSMPQGPRHGMFDERGERRSYETMSALHKQMFESRLEAHKQILEVLTPQQREQLARIQQPR